MKADRSVLTVDGYGISLTVRRGQLQVSSGMADGRAVRELSRADRTIRRIVVLADTGTVSLDALRWCADVRIAVVQLDRDGRLLMTSAAPSTDDARLRRAQAAAASSPVGISIARALLTAKLDGQAANLADLLDAPQVANTITGLRDRTAGAEKLKALRDLEATASNIYFGAWGGQVQCTFAAAHVDRVPEHWHGFTVRRSPLHTGKTNRSAATPINSLLNLGYGLAEAVSRIAAITVGLDPGLGIVHTDIKARDSLALDLLEPLRPVVERHVLRLLAVRRFTRDDFAETRDGTCRVLAPLSHELVELMPQLAAAVAPLAEAVVHAVARSSPGKIELRTPLTRANTRAAQAPGARSARRRPAADLVVLPSCRTCGAPLHNKDRQLCSACWPVSRNAYAGRRNAASHAARVAAIAAGQDPSQTATARARRRSSLLATKAAEAEWEQSGAGPVVTEAELLERVLPALAGCSLALMQQRTGLSNSSCSRIRAGRMTPHPRHWDALGALSADGVV